MMPYSRAQALAVLLASLQPATQGQNSPTLAGVPENTVVTPNTADQRDYEDLKRIQQEDENKWNSPPTQFDPSSAPAPTYGPQSRGGILTPGMARQLAGLFGLAGRPQA